VDECLRAARKGSAAGVGVQDHESELEDGPIHCHQALAVLDPVVAAEVGERPTGEQLDHEPTQVGRPEDEHPGAQGRCRWVRLPRTVHFGAVVGGL
jgi:hypothetical protein